MLIQAFLISYSIGVMQIKVFAHTTSRVLSYCILFCVIRLEWNDIIQLRAYLVEAFQHFISFGKNWV